MKSEFDPYSTWLGIKSKDRPLNHYQLLGLKAFENRTNVIDESSLKQIEHLQDIATGSSQVELSQRVLNEVSAARICLLNPKKRARYDLSLKKQMAGLISAEELIRLHAESEEQEALVAEVENAQSIQPLQRTTPARKPSTATRSKVRSRSKKRRWVLPVFGMLVPLVIGIGILIAVYVYVTPNLMQEFESLSDLRQDPATTPVDTIVIHDEDEFSDPLGLGESDPALKQLLAPLVEEPIFDPEDELPNEPKPVEPEKSSNPASEPENKAIKVADATAKNKPANPVVSKTKPAKPETKKTKPAKQGKPKPVPRVIASYDASKGKPQKRKPNSIQSPTKQGWIGNDSADKTDINEGAFDPFPVWKNGDSKYDGIDFSFKLEEQDLKDMWIHGWQFEIIARPIKETYLIGWSVPNKSEYFKTENPSQPLIIFQPRPNNKGFVVRTSWSEKNKPVNRVTVEKGYAKVVLTGKPKSNLFNWSVSRWQRETKQELIKTFRDQPFKRGRNLPGHITWSTTNPGKSSGKPPRTSKAYVHIHKVELSVPGPK